MIKSILPKTLYNLLKKLYHSSFGKWVRLKFFLIYLFYLNIIHKIQIKKIRKKSKIKVLFIVINKIYTFKFYILYNFLKKDARYEPLILLCPCTDLLTGGIDNNQSYDDDYKMFISSNFNVMLAYNANSKKYLNVEIDLKPDIIFYTYPWPHTHKNYKIERLKNYLSCYVQYSFHVSYLNKAQYNAQFHNLLWKAFYETKTHLKFAQETADNNGKNVVVTGYPGIDIFLDDSYIPQNNWKIENNQVKRIIWSPHHTIYGFDEHDLKYSDFMEYHQFFKNFITNNNDFQMAFKPHPLLKRKLIMHPEWGLNKTNEYYSFWENQPNTLLCESDYHDLFLTSDALIHSCGSFLTEYLFVNKPVAFNLINSEILNRFNDFGKNVLKTYILTKSEKDILDFLNDIKNNLDINKNKRQIIINQYLQETNYTSASQNIYNYLNHVFKN